MKTKILGLIVAIIVVFTLVVAFLAESAWAPSREPTGALDSKTGIVVLEALERINRELGTATAIITHNADIAGMADRVIHLSNGRIAEVKANSVKKSPGELQW